MMNKFGKSSGVSVSTPESELEKTIWKWCEATGLPTTVTVHLENRCYRLHKFPLVSRSGYLKRKLSESSEIVLPKSCPAGVEIFELVVLFCYGSTILMDPLNVAALRCAAEFFEMIEEFGRGNLCERSDLYLTQVVLQSWEDTLIVLQKCQCLLPLADELLVVSRCIESLAFMACMEVLDPEHTRTRSAMAAECQFCSELSTSFREATAKDWWIKDLLVLPFQLFERIIASMRRQGMKEKYVSPVIIMYANKWILSNRRHSGNSTLKCRWLEGIIKLLPLGRRSNVIPIHFLFSLLSEALICGSSNESNAQLQARIASQLDLATIEDFLLPMPMEIKSNTSIAFSPEVESMRNIFSMFIAQEYINCKTDESAEFSLGSEEALEQSSNSCCSFNKNTVSTVASMWDEYLVHIAFDAGLSPSEFLELVEIIPASARCTHDMLYKAVHTYLMAHPEISQQERQTVCKHLSCQKMSQETCMHAVQNGLMPLRLTVQAMFIQQLHTRQVLRSNSNMSNCSRSMRLDSTKTSDYYSQPNFFSQELSSTAKPNENNTHEEPLPFGLLLKRDAAFRQEAAMRADYEATSFRLQNLEQELVCMRKNLQQNKDNKKHRHNKDTHTNSSVKSESFRISITDKYLDTKCRRNFLVTSSSCGKWFLRTDFVHKVVEAFQKISIFNLSHHHDKDKKCSQSNQKKNSFGLPLKSSSQTKFQ
ncbi:hypothetical protein SUGI_0961270 [Cryptomeria japonica]|uniref:BTB/POZ domain-containing protein At5g48130 n=1 Tax=Cryptomeria japonica TaxID=3369 RepID=UPI002414AE0E|nr:BTB/POZ domain-containing protein At5g48130 [Cryptomeria japonica]GLJ45670.1 hypothetical protein SUGI_0961270 [Cryptomeria japonica]